MLRTLFGTDGIRGPANVYPMTVEISLALGKALGHFINLSSPPHSLLTPVRRPLSSSGLTRKKIVIGKDTRLSGYCFEQALSAGICSMGVDVLLVGPIPTPGVAFLTRDCEADAGIMISASHNPFADNGIKLFGLDGHKLSDAIELELERLVFNSPKLEAAQSHNIGKAFRLDDGLVRYADHLRKVLNGRTEPFNMKIVLDCAHGAAYKIAPKLFRELGFDVIEIGTQPDGVNINESVGSTNPVALQKKVLQCGADFGVAFDGDADRVVFVDELGELVHPDALIVLFAKHLSNTGKLERNTIVTTVMSDLGLEQNLRAHGIKVVRTQVGDRYVVEQLRESGFNFGGEDSGHLIFLDYATTGDGILSALILAVMLENNLPLSHFKTIFKPSPRVVINQEILEKVPLDEISGLLDEIEGSNKRIAGYGRVFVRYSGTEQRVRILVEGVEQQEAKIIAQNIAQKFVDHDAESAKKIQHELVLDRTPVQ